MRRSISSGTASSSRTAHSPTAISSPPFLPILPGKQNVCKAIPGKKKKIFKKKRKFRKERVYNKCSGQNMAAISV